MSTAEDVVDRRYGNHLNGYYDGVVSLLHNAHSIWIFGPGEAKVELQKRLNYKTWASELSRLKRSTK